MATPNPAHSLPLERTVPGPRPQASYHRTDNAATIDAIQRGDGRFAGEANLIDMPDEGHLLDLLARVVPDETLRHQILVHNPEVLYGFGSDAA